MRRFFAFWKLAGLASKLLPVENRVVLEGCTFQPYRINSPSYVIGGFE